MVNSQMKKGLNSSRLKEKLTTASLRGEGNEARKFRPVFREENEGAKLEVLPLTMTRKEEEEWNVKKNNSRKEGRI